MLGSTRAKHAIRLLEQFSSTGLSLTDPRDRSFESQVYRASGLNLLIAAIILSSCGTRYLQAAFVELQRAGFPTIITHLAPFRWEHIGLTGDYVWTDAEQLCSGRSGNRNQLARPE